VEFLEGSAEELPLPDASFDRYAANFVLYTPPPISQLTLPLRDNFARCRHLVTDPDRMLREARRVLRPGGAAAFSVWGRPENSPFWTLVPTVQKEVGISTRAPLLKNT
jgi:ubiquinone/menaquinone biosynthesis C-methylase UbiE